MRRHNQPKQPFPKRHKREIPSDFVYIRDVSTADENVRAAVLGYINDVSSNHSNRFMHFEVNYDLIMLHTDERWSEKPRRAIMRLGEDVISCVCSQLGLDYGIAYADPKMFDMIDQFISRVYNG